MHPAPSVLVFTVLSGLGFGALAFLAVFVHPYGWPAFALWGLGYGLAIAGLLASTFHLGHPERAWRAFSQWRTSWLSREGLAAVATLVLLAPVALSDWLGLGLPRAFAVPGAVLALATIATTSMIYAQLKTVPRWNHWTTPAQFFAFALAGGAMLTGQGVAPLLLALLALALLAHWHYGDRRFAEVGASMGSATGLGPLGRLSVFDPAHTAGNYLMREMIFVVGRKHAARLRVIALVFACLIPALILFLPAHPATTGAAVLAHLVGAFAARWLFFAEAEHVVGLYYGKRQ
ncbi:dimethyl sulfoxide reductase anchor subunit family protein [Tabrizicola oligotrophica]|uniref:Dimethyl sulfoxide reductase anchor subunit n=1 Tax=Tabrizicola oligotrophica TaxID=2710650 RepID=A0A6M0QYZ8_9RHOB|nr:DmsC/YnfH family molybdoenzyme membrane anchor subunit [Tabrizicola oligotrophica]NEY91682.1 dimethyl sulfoxide reductase anchor subunit [Tabrizicola oligotrophica]